MAREELCVLMNMCMICDGDKVLVQDRKNPDWPGITFPGGHVERRESFADAVIREVKEETGLTISHVQLCGVKQWLEENDDRRYVVLMYKTDCFTGELKSSEEGEVFWIERSQLQDYVLAEGFEGMLEVFEREELSEQYIWCENGVWERENK